MKIAISMRVSEDSSFQERRDCLAHDWYLFFEAINAASPILIPNINSFDPAIFFSNNVPDAVVLSGGNNIASCSHQSDLVPERDNVESLLIDYCVNNDIPLLGVCRGMQFINTYFGGKVSPVILEQSHVGGEHSVSLSMKELISVYGEKSISVNTYHDYCINSGDLSSLLNSGAVSTDDVHEALYHPAHLVMGVQWHPERNNPLDLKEIEFFKKYFTKEIDWRN